MFDVHSIIGVVLRSNKFFGGNKYEIHHDPDNYNTARKVRGAIGIYEVECSAKTLIATAEADIHRIINISNVYRDYRKCPEPLVRQIVTHYQRVREALIEGKHLDSYFADTKEWDDVWKLAIANNAPVVLPEMFRGKLIVSGSAKLDAPELKEVGGCLSVSDSAEFAAPQLKEVGGFLSMSGRAKFAALVKVGGNPVGGNISMSDRANLDAPQLKEVGYLSMRGSAKFDAPQLEKVGDCLGVSASAKLNAPQLKEVGGSITVTGIAKLDALVKVGGNITVTDRPNIDAPQYEKAPYIACLREEGELDAPQLKEVVGNLSMSGRAKLAAPQLEKVGGNLSMSDSAEFAAPQLKEVGGFLSVSGSVKLDALVKVGGNITVTGRSAERDALEFLPKSKVLGGYIYVSASAGPDGLGGPKWIKLPEPKLMKLDVPQLKAVGGNITVTDSGKLDAPQLQSVNGKPHNA